MKDIYFRPMSEFPIEEVRRERSEYEGKIFRGAKRIARRVIKKYNIDETKPLHHDTIPLFDPKFPKDALPENALLGLMESICARGDESPDLKYQCEQDEGLLIEAGLPEEVISEFDRDFTSLYIKLKSKKS